MESYKDFKLTLDFKSKKQEKAIKVYLNQCKGSNKKLKNQFKKYYFAENVFDKTYQCSISEKNTLNVKVGGKNLTDIDRNITTPKTRAYKTTNYKINYLSLHTSKDLQALKCSLHYLDSNFLVLNNELNTNNVFVKLMTPNFEVLDTSNFGIDYASKQILLNGKNSPCVNYNVSSSLKETFEKNNCFISLQDIHTRKKYPYKVKYVLYKKAKINRVKKEATYTIDDSLFTFDISSLGEFYFIYGMFILLDGTKILMYESYKYVNSND